MTTTLSPLPVFQWINSQGQPLVGGQLFSYAAGTSTLLATYTDSTGGTTNTNPIILDASGSAPVWLGSANYKLVLKDAIGNVLWTIDNINATQGSFVSSQGGTIYLPGGNTALVLNSDSSFSSGILFQVGGVNSSIISTNGIGTTVISNWTGSTFAQVLTLSGTTASFTGSQWTFGTNTTGSPNVNINGIAGTTRTLYYQTASTNRWGVGADGSSESGSNAGSNYIIQAFADGGSSLGTAAACVRSTLAWTFPGSINSPSITDTSDKRKKNIKADITISEASEWIDKLEPVHFAWKSSGREDIGLIAQEVEKILPEIVSEDANGFLGVSYQKLVCPLIVLIKEQQKRIEALEAKIK